MTKYATVQTNTREASGEPMPGLSKRATEQLKPKVFGVYARARASSTEAPKTKPAASTAGL